METNLEIIKKSHGTVAHERVRADLENLTRDAEVLLKATTGDVSEKAKEARSRVAAALERAKTTCAHRQKLRQTRRPRWQRNTWGLYPIAEETVNNLFIAE